MEEEPKLPQNLPLLNEIAQVRNLKAAQRAWLAWLDASARADGANADLERNIRSLAQLKHYVAQIDEAIDRAAHVTQRAPLYDLATIAFGEMVRDILLDSPAGRAGLKAVVERVANEAKKLQAAEAARAAAADEAARRERDAAIAAEVRGVNVDSMLDAIAAAGVDLGIVGNEIHAVPAGKLSFVQRRVFAERRDEVLARLEQRNQAETL